MLRSILIIFLFIAFLVNCVIQAQTVETISTEFNASGGVAVNKEGEVFVADFGLLLGRASGTNVFKVDKHTGEMEIYATGFIGASGNAFDSHGNLIQSNIGGNRISKISPDGLVSTLATDNIAGPVGVAIDDNDTIFIANCGNNTIARITPDGVSTEFASSFLMRCPNGLAMDDDGNLYTCNFGNGRILKIDRKSREVSALATLPTDRNGHLTYANGRLYVAGRCNHSIYEVLLTGEFKKIAGTGGRGNKDGTALEATFNHPNGIDASPDGDTLYINDATSLGGDCLSVSLNPVVLRRIVGVKSTLTPVEETESLRPEDFRLMQNYPNPFNPETTINYSLTVSDVNNVSTIKVSLTVYDILGKNVAVLVNEYQGPGYYEIYFDASDLPSGIYIYRLHAGSYSEAKRMLLLK